MLIGKMQLKINFIILLLLLLMICIYYTNEYQIAKNKIETVKDNFKLFSKCILLYNAYEMTKCVYLIDLKGKYLSGTDKPFIDPWNNVIRLISNEHEYYIISSGPDGIYGTDDDIKYDLNLHKFKTIH